MEILFVHEVDWVNKVKFEIHELPELLSLRGHRIDFVDFSEQTRLSGLRKWFSPFTVIKSHESHTYLGSRVRVITPGRLLPPPLDRLAATLTFVPALISLLSKTKYNLIVLYSVPTNGWQTLLLARMFGVPVLFRGLDVSHEIRRTRLRFLIKIAERFVYRHATWLSANNSRLLDYCIEMGANPKTSSVNFAGVFNGQFVRNSGGLSLRAELQIPDEAIVACYLGSLFEFSGLSRFVEELANYRGEHDVFLVIAGDGPNRDTLVSQVKSYDLENRVRFLGRVEFDEISNLLGIADCGLVPFELLPVSNFAFPWKSVQYLAAGIPIVSTELQGLRSVFPEGHGVTYVSQDESIIDRVCWLISDPILGEEIVAKGKMIVDQAFSWTTNLTRFEQLFDQVAKHVCIER